MRYDADRLPAEYTDLVLLLSKISTVWVRVLIRTYEGKDLEIRFDGVPGVFCNGAPMVVGGKELCVWETEIVDDGLWDVCIEYRHTKTEDTTRKSYLQMLEQKCEDYGYCVVSAGDCLCLECMDRVIFNGFSIESSEALCRDFGIDFEKVCAEAIKDRVSTYEVLRSRISQDDMECMYCSDEKDVARNTKDGSANTKVTTEKKNEQKMAVEGVKIFNETLHSKL